MDAAQALQKVGNSGRYQYFVLAYMCLFWVEIVYMLLGPSYIYMNPTFKCQSTGDWIVEEQQACPMIETCQLIDPYTITAELGLYCKKQTQRNMIQAVMYVGSILGLVIMNLISDKYGRKFGFLLSTASCVVGAVFVNIGAFSKIVALIIIGQLFVGFGAYACYVISYIILTDLFSDTLRQRGIVIVNAAWGLGEVSFYFLYSYLRQWQYFTVGFLLIPLIGWLVLGKILLIESPVFLNEHSREKCSQALNKIAAWNNKPHVQPDELQVYPRADEEVSIFQIFKNWAYMKPILFIGLYATAVNCYYYGTQYSMEDIGSNFGINMLIVGLLEFTAYFSSTFFIDKIKRKRTMMLLSIVVGACASLFLIPAVKNSKTIQMIIVPFTRFLVSMILSYSAYCQGLLALFMSESFPDRVKSSGAGTIEALSNVGNIVTPFIVSATTNIGLSAVFVVGLIMLAGVFALVPTKETFNHHVTEEEVLKESLLSQDGGVNINTEKSLDDATTTD